MTRVYPRKPCTKCGVDYPSNVLPQHQDQCSGDALTEVAKKTQPLPNTAVSFVWAKWDGRTLHAIDEEQVATSQEGFCEQAPNPGHLWARANELDLGFEKDYLGNIHEMPKCEVCEQRTRGCRNITMQVNRIIDRQDKRNTAADNRDRKRRGLPRRGPE